MKLTNYVMDLGRPVAYYPNLKILTGSTTATIMLCQLLYWTPRTKHKDKWIYKTNYEIEEETGLTYNEQKTAKRILRDMGLIVYEVKRWDRVTRYRVEEETLNNLWESIKAGSTRPISDVTIADGEDEEELPVEKTETSAEPTETPEEYFKKKSANVVGLERESRKPPEKKGDLVDGMLASLKDYGMKKAERIEDITVKIAKILKINVHGPRWESFIEFVYTREMKGESVEVFLKWLTSREDFDPTYWSPERMMTYYPQAFAKEEESKDFVKNLPKRVEKEVIPMPNYVKGK